MIWLVKNTDTNSFPTLLYREEKNKKQTNKPFFNHSILRH